MLGHGTGKGNLSGMLIALLPHDTLANPTIGEERTMKKYHLIIFLFTLLLTASGTALAANHYIRVGATGANNGSDWTNAYTRFPSSFIRGDTYYVAGGVFINPLINIKTPVDGEKYIAFLKATITDHGTDEGWQDSFGTSQTVFRVNQDAINLQASYVVFDGVVGSDNDTLSYGFAIIQDNCAGTNTDTLMNFGSNVTLSHVRMSHVSLTNCGDTYAFGQYNLYHNPYTAPSTQMTISNNYFVGGTANMLIRNWQYCTIENNYFAGNWSSPRYHGEQISSGKSCQHIILRNNVFANSSVYVVGMHVDNNTAWSIYNNIVLRGDVVGAFASADSASIDVWKSSYVHNNTFIDVQMGGEGAFFVGNLSNPSWNISSAYNNIFYNCTNPRLDNMGYSGIIQRGGSYHYLSSGVYDSIENGTAQISDVDIMKNKPSGLFSLKQHTAPGIVLSEPFNIDIVNRSRPTDDVWDRGAYQFGRISSPDNLHIPR